MQTEVKNCESLGIEHVRKINISQNGDDSGVKESIVDVVMQQIKTTSGVTGGTVRAFVIETNPDFTSPGYSWWDCAPPAAAGALNAACSTNTQISSARRRYDSVLASREARL